MACTGNDQRLLAVAFAKDFSDLLCCLIAIEDGHGAVHEDKAVLHSLAELLLHYVYGLLAIVGEVNVAGLLFAKGLLKKEAKPHLVERLVVYE